MPRRVISQKRVRQLETWVAQLEGLLRCPGIYGTLIDTINISNVEALIAQTARTLGHAVIVVPIEGNKFRVYAVKP